MTEVFESMRQDVVKGSINGENADTNILKERKKAIDEYLKRVNVYQKREPLNFDLRGYTAYLEEHGIDGKNVPEEVVEKFRIKPMEKNVDE